MQTYIEVSASPITFGPGRRRARCGCQDILPHVLGAERQAGCGSQSLKRTRPVSLFVIDRRKLLDDHILKVRRTKSSVIVSPDGFR
jgi:hypothetical protein